MTVPVLLGNAVDAISKNGVVMMNVALRGDGTLPDIQADYLRAFGDWVRINGDAVYGSRPWKIYGEGPTQIITKRSGENLKSFTAADIRFTTKDGNLYAFVLAPPAGDIIIKILRTGGLFTDEIGRITMFGSHEALRWSRSADGLTITKPEHLPDQPVVVFRITKKRTGENRSE